MIKVFDEYSKYYDLLYKDKDYVAEAEYISSLIKRFAPEAKTILELGCGTGKHAFLLAKEGYDILGIDLSETMLEDAKNLGINCVLGDARTFRANKTFNTVISLFHVAGYQVTNQDVNDYFNTAQIHLEKGGVFIFDCWYGPAVLKLRPEFKIKYFENEFLKIERKATPVHYMNENRVEVNYDIKIRNKSDNSVQLLHETHNVRYFFKPELEEFLNKNNIKLIHSEVWLTGEIPSEDSWGVCFVGVKQ